VSADPVEAYLDELADQLRSLPGSDLRRVLAEAEDHLRTGIAAFTADGISQEEATAQAIEAFGSPATVAGDVRRSHPSGLVGLALDAVRKLSLVAVAGLCAIGLSGLLSDAGGAVFGKSFIAGDAPGVTYSAERCAYLLEYYPNAGTCEAAATAHHFEEIVWYRLAAGVLGVIGLIALLVLVRRGIAGRWLRTGPLPATTAPVVATVLFGAAAAALCALGLMSVALGLENHAGSFLSDGTVATVAFALSAWWLVRTVRGDGALQR